MCRSTSSTATVPPGKTFVSEIRSRPEPLVAEGAADAAPSTFTSPMRFALGAEEVVEPLHLVHVLLEERVPGGVVARALGERSAVARRTLLDVADVAGDAGQVLRSRLAVVPEVDLVSRERRLAFARLGRLDPVEQLRAVRDVVPLAHDQGAEEALVHPIQVPVRGVQLVPRHV